ncbi:MAG: RND family transporter [Dehalococcoidia bacterium]
MTLSPSLSERLGDVLTRHSGRFILGVLFATLLLAIPMVLLAPEEQASQDPGGPVFDLQEKINQRFPPRIHVTSFILEDREGDVLRQASLWEIYRNEQRLRNSELDDFLFNGYDADNRRHIVGIFTIADAVQNFFILDPRTTATLETATDAQVKEALHHIFSGPSGALFRRALSRDAVSEKREYQGREVDYWQSRAMSLFVASDNQRLGGGPSLFNLSNDAVTLGKERYNRQVQEILRGDQTNYRMWGIAIDLNLTAQEQGRTTIPFIVATIIVVLLVVALALRSLAIVGLTFVGLAMLLVWLKGWSNLIGLKSSLTLDLIVPIAMISLGVDFLIHAIARYQEERYGNPSRSPALALRAGLVGVLGALTLAMLSDGVAFLANVTSGIETVIGFGIAAGIAVLSSYLIMGLFIPVVVMRWDQRREGHRLAAARGGGEERELPSTPPVQQAGGIAEFGTTGVRAGIAGVVVWLARRHRVILPLALLLTIGSTYMAFQLEPKLDVKEFFDSDSDFVVSLDKLDEHTATALSGEPANIYIEGDLTAPESLRALRELLARLGANPSVAQTQEGEAALYARTVFSLLRQMIDSDFARSQVANETGVRLSDRDQDGILDSSEQLRAAYGYMFQKGVPLDERTAIYDPVQIRETLYLGPDEAKVQATAIVFGVLSTREQANVKRARATLEQDLAPLRELPTITFAGVTGSPFARQETLVATTRALNISLPVAVVACFLLLLLWLRSVRFALVSIIPIGLVVSWLYAFMYLAGFNLNFVTATIAAISIGVGIDFSIHMTVRYREELARRPDLTQVENLRAAAAGTGVALVGSAASSVIGFAVMSFAPMPLFSAYGILTATMIAMAAVASLLVLPSLLLLATPRRSG